MKIQKKTMVLFLFPILAIFIFTVIIPFMLGVFYAFTNWDGISSSYNIVGMENFRVLFRDEKFLQSLKLTCLFALISVVLINLIGLSFALLVTKKVKFQNFYRAAYFFPNLIGGLILGFVWQFVFTEVFAFFGRLFSTSGEYGIFFNWLKDPTFAFIALIFVTTWQMAGYVMVIYIASLQTIPDTLIEAAKMDGATGIKTFLFVKLPLIIPAFTISLFITLSNTLKIYDTNLALTGGGPYGTTELVTMNIYNEAFALRNLGLAQSKAIFFLLIIAIITIIQITMTKRLEVEA